jgi:hypothetical protein
MKVPLSELSSKVFLFYLDGFRNMSAWGKKVWIIILIKLFIIFLILKVFFFPDILKRDYENDGQRSEYILDQLTKSSEVND